MNGNTAVMHKEQNKEDKWAEVMQLAEKYGFIRSAYAGVAILSIEEEVIKNK